MLDLVLHMLAQLLVERAERFVHQHQFSVEHQRAGQRDALLLTARKLRRATTAKGAHLHHVERALHLRLDIGLAHFPHFQRKGEIFGHRHMREKGVVLEHHTDAALMRRDVVDRLAVQANVAMGRGFKTGEHHKAGCFAGT